MPETYTHKKKGKQALLILELVKNMLYLTYVLVRLNFTSLTVARFTCSHLSDPYSENFSMTVCSYYSIP